MTSRTLREFGETARKIFPLSEWVTYDGYMVKVFASKKRPFWLNGTWCGTEQVAVFYPPRRGVCVKGFHTGSQGKDFSACIWGFEDSVRKIEVEMERRKKSTTRTKGVIAYYPDGSTIRFDSYEECKEYFGFKRVDKIKDYIDSGESLEDGTTLDEAADEDYIHQIYNEQ